MFGIGGVNHGGRAETIGTTYTDGSAVTGTTITASGTANSKGSWTSLGTPSFQYEAFDFVVAQTAASDKIIDIGINDGSGNWHVIVADLQFYGRKSADLMYGYGLPVRLKSGQQVGVRCAASTASHVLNVALTGYSRGDNGGAGYSRMVRIDTPGTSRGVAVDAGATASTKGAWTQLIASTAQHYDALMVMVGQNADTTRTATATALLDVGLGASSSEFVLIPNIFMRWTTTLDGPLLKYGPCPVQVPAGVRLAARLACTDATAGDRTADVAIYGLRA